MPCNDCDKNGCNWRLIQMPCAVCEKLSGDSKPKYVCMCFVCKKFICKDHWDNYTARGAAAFLELMDTGMKAVKKIFKRQRIKK